MQISHPGEWDSTMAPIRFHSTMTPQTNQVTPVGTAKVGTFHWGVVPLIRRKVTVDQKLLILISKLPVKVKITPNNSLWLEMKCWRPFWKYSSAQPPAILYEKVGMIFWGLILIYSDASGLKGLLWSRLKMLLERKFQNYNKNHWQFRVSSCKYFYKKNDHAIAYSPYFKILHMTGTDLMNV